MPNTAPILLNPLNDMTALEYNPFIFTLPADTFYDADLVNGDALTYSATLADGSALPSWLSFDAATQTFSGTPGPTDLADFNITVTVTDAGGLTVSDSFVLGIFAGEITGTPGDDNLIGTASRDLMYGLAGNDILDGRAGADTMIGGLGDDTYYVDNAGDVVAEDAGAGTDTVITKLTSYTLGDNVENLDISSRTASVVATGNELDNVITANGNYNYGGAADVVDGGLGADTMSARGGNDTYYVDNAGDVVIEYAGEGTDTVISSISYALAANVENMTLVGSGLVATGNDLNNSYTINTTGNSVVEAANGGTDTVVSSVSYTLDANVEKLTLTGADAISGTGNELDNSFYTSLNTAENVLAGGLGNDYYSIFEGDTVIENAGEGVDTIAVHNLVTADYSGYPTYTEFLTNEIVTYTLGANVENLTLHAYLVNGFSYKAYGVGNELDNVLFVEGSTNNDVLDGGAGADTMSAGLFNDTYYVDNAGDVVIEDAGAETGTDTVISTVSYTLGANVENMILVGTGLVATGNNLNNSYSINTTGNSVAEAANGGTDTVVSSVSYTLDANVEQLVLSGADAINGTGNALDNALYGISHGAFGSINSGANVLAGGLGNDTYYLGEGDTVVELVGEGTDTVITKLTSYTLADNVENLDISNRTLGVAGVGNELDNVITARGNYAYSGASDVIDGGAGADTMSASLGNDTYYVDNASDIVIENAGEGTDTIYSSVDYTVSANVENMVLTGVNSINATGNALNNVLTGNGADNLLDGGAGNDTISGGLGIDILQGGDGNDALSDTGGNNLFSGGAGTDTLTGNTGNELFIGGTGNDTITTGSGADIIAFNRGDGQDTVVASTGADNTISLGGGIGYQSLALSKSGNNLILDTGNGDQINLQNWFASTANRSVVNLQIVLDNMTYNPASLDTLVNRQVQCFDFAALANDFDQALAANPTLTAWNMADALLSTHLSGSDGQALGGDLAYQYNLNNSLAGIGVVPAQAVMGNANFGVAPQLLQPLASLQTGAARLG